MEHTGSLSTRGELFARLTQGAGPAALVLVFGVIAMLSIGSVAQADPTDLGLSFESRDFGSRANPPLPDAGTYPVQMVLDDDNPEGVFGFSGSTARQFLWFNRFANPGAFQLQEIWVLFPAGSDVPAGGAIQLVVYFDPDGDPNNGAQLLATFDENIQAVDGQTFSVYTLPYPVSFGNGGDVLVGVINRYFSLGDPPPTQPAALDTSSVQGRSYVALWAGDPPVSPDLATAINIEVVDGQVGGNFMIRAFGATLRDTAIPTLSQWGIGLLVLLLAGAALWRLRFATA